VIEAVNEMKTELENRLVIKWDVGG